MSRTPLNSDPAYLKAAFGDLGLSEIPGPRHSARVLQLFKASGHPEIKNDETAWCAAAVGGWLAESGIPGSGSLMARSYAKYGKACDLDDTVPRGAIVVWPRGAPPSGHVNICLEDDGTYLTCIGGNQGNGSGGGVTISRERKRNAIAARLPVAPPKMKPVRFVPDEAEHEPDDTKPHAAPADAPKTGITEGAVGAGGLTLAGIFAQVWEAVSQAPDTILQAVVGLAQKPAFLVAIGVLGAVGFIWWQRSRMKKA